MVTLGMTGTKWDLFTTAIDLFSKNGYGNVSIRELAQKVGVKSAAIYYHFKNKDDILSQIFKFYNDNYFALLPDLDEISKLITKLHPYEIFKKLDFFYEEELHKLMIKITLIAVKEIDSDQRAKALVDKIYLEIPKKYYGAILSKMIEQNVIEPLDVETWTTVFAHYDLASIFRHCGNSKLSHEEWLKGRHLLYSLIRAL